MKLEVQSVSKTFRRGRGDVSALVGVNLDVEEGECVCLLGPSGCGKSTLLNTIAGLEQPDSGRVLVDGELVNGPGPDRVVMFQEAALFPWLNVLDNVCFGLTIAGVPRAERLVKARQYLQLVHLSGFEKAYVHELSGGMKQRAALARALVLNPQVLLMDEPFAALDALTRDALHDELQEIWEKTCQTVIFVTHNVREAIVLGSRVVLMSARPGRVKRIYKFDLPRPRHIEDPLLVDATRQVLSDLRDVVQAAQEEEHRVRLAA